MVGKLEHSHIADKNVKGVATLANSLAVAQNVKHRIIIWPRDFTPRHILKRKKHVIHTHKCT